MLGQINNWAQKLATTLKWPNSILFHIYCRTCPLDNWPAKRTPPNPRFSSSESPAAAMRAVRGRVTSSEPVSLKQATQIISTFAARDNHASQAVTSYLKRSAASFNDLLLLRRDLRRSRRPADPRPEEPQTRAFRESRRRGRKRDGSDGKAAAGGRDKVGLFVKDDEEKSDWKGQKSMSEVDIVVSVEENVMVAVEGGTEKDGVASGEEGGKKAKGKKRGGEEEQSKKKKKKRRRSEEEKA